MTIIVKSIFININITCEENIGLDLLALLCKVDWCGELEIDVDIFIDDGYYNVYHARKGDVIVFLNKYLEERNYYG